jgi:hypothetical protein
LRSTFLLLISLLLPTAAWGDAENRTASTVSSATWTDATVGVLESDNDVRASHANADGIDSVYCTNFGFTIPTDATIDTIFIITQGFGSAGQAARRRILVGPTKDGTSYAGDESENINQDQDVDTDNTTTGGDGATPLWSTTWTYTDINSSTFGAIFRNNVTQAGTVEIDKISVKVVYTPAAVGGNSQVMRTIIE